MRVRPTSEDELEQIIAAGGRRGEIYRGMRNLRDRHADLIRERYPKLPRRVSGYNLDELLPERGFNVARTLTGSEGTLATATGSRAPSCSDDVHEALDLCLACKGCKAECPVSVDMATYKAEFLSRYHKRRLRPMHAYTMGLIMLHARGASLLPGLANALVGAPGAELLGEHTDGWEPPPLRRRALLHGDCHHEAIIGIGADERVLAQMGLDVEALDSGCCGVAGSFGFEHDHYDISVAIGEPRRPQRTRRHDPRCRRLLMAPTDRAARRPRPRTPTSTRVDPVGERSIPAWSARIPW